MIKLDRPPAPIQLTPQVAADLTDTFARDNMAAVWNKPYIRATLMTMSHNKCAYCETPVDEESKYMEVDHYYCKTGYPDRVVQWTNLLPSCKRCNVNKGAHDVAHGTLIDPTIDNPPEHLRLSNYRLHGRDQKGRLTVEVLYLNQTDRVVKKRFDIGNYVADTLDNLSHQWNTIGDPNADHKRIRVSRGLRTLMNEAQPSSEYSATAATAIIEHPYYTQLKSGLTDAGLWSQELGDLESAIVRNALR